MLISNTSHTDISSSFPHHITAHLEMRTISLSRGELSLMRTHADNPIATTKPYARWRITPCCLLPPFKHNLESGVDPTPYHLPAMLRTLLQTDRDDLISFSSKGVFCNENKGGSVGVCEAVMRRIACQSTYFLSSWPSTFFPFPQHTHVFSQPTTHCPIPVRVRIVKECAFCRLF